MFILALPKRKEEKSIEKYYGKQENNIFEGPLGKLLEETGKSAELLGPSLPQAAKMRIVNVLRSMHDAQPKNESIVEALQYWEGLLEIA
jgi:hypothetical protein